MAYHDGLPQIGRLIECKPLVETKPQPTLDQVIEATKLEPVKVPEQPKPWYPALVDAIGLAGMLAKDIQAWILTGKHVALQGEAMLATCKFITYAVGKDLIEIADNGRVFSRTTQRERKLMDIIYSVWKSRGGAWVGSSYDINQQLLAAGLEPATRMEMDIAWRSLKTIHNIKAGCIS